jgi:hypothetical protein
MTRIFTLPIRWISDQGKSAAKRPPGLASPLPNRLLRLEYTTDGIEKLHTASSAKEAEKIAKEFKVRGFEAEGRFVPA